MSCEHKEVKARVVVVQKRYYELTEEGYVMTAQESDEVDWNTAYLECLDCGKELKATDIDAI